jgi:N-acetylneuraminic acid mutarotase
MARLHFLLLLLIAIPALFFSCTKELSCEKCNNKQPVAIAGNDTSFYLPVNNVSLNGYASFDTDGKITNYQWSMLDGHSDVKFEHSDSAATRISDFIKGLYQFQLTVQDDGGLRASDTIIVIVKDPVEINLPPIADAGPDQEITFPINAVLLKGTGSADPNHNISKYTWSIIDGPATFYLPGPHSVNSLVQDMQEGIYFFQLKVEDDAGLFDLDTVKIKVNAIKQCPQINGRITSIGKISEARHYPTVVSSGDKIFYAGGYGPGGLSSRVDIYDTRSNQWKQAELSSARTYISAVAAGNKVYFAGGILAGDIPSATIDIYDILKDEWTAVQMSQARFFIAAAHVKNKIVFAGGSDDATSGRCTNTVDILDITTNAWTTATLGQPGYGLTALAVDDKLYITGGDYSCRKSDIDIFDATTNTWSKTKLTEPKLYLTAIEAEGKIYWAGGYEINHKPSVKVEMVDLKSGDVSFTEMCNAIAGFKAKVYRRHNSLLFFSGDGLNPVKFNVYDFKTQQWFEGSIDKKLVGAEIVVVNNIIYISGGTVDGVLSDRLWKLEF